MHAMLKQHPKTDSFVIFFKNDLTNATSLPSEKEYLEFSNLIRQINPDIIGFSVLSHHAPVAKELTKRAKEQSQALIAWGGIHPTISPESCIKYADIICRGEGEGFTIDLVNKLQQNADISSISNAWVKDSTGSTTKNDMRPLIKDLDTLPFPTFCDDNFYFIDNNTLTTTDRAVYSTKFTMQTSRGCPFHCGFCVNGLLHELYADLGTYSRRKSPERSIDEILDRLSLFKTKVDYIIFNEECFSMSSKWINKFCSLYKEKINIPFRIEYNPASINLDILQPLKDAGLQRIRVGVQSGSDRIRNTVYDRKGKNKDIIDIAAKVRQLNIEIDYDIIVNSPYEDEASLIEAIELVSSLPKPWAIGMYNLQFFPKYPLTNRAIQDKLITKESVSEDNLLLSTGSNFSFAPQIFPKSKKSAAQSLLWLLVMSQDDKLIKKALRNEHIADHIARYYAVYILCNYYKASSSWQRIIKLKLMKTNSLIKSALLQMLLPGGLKQVYKKATSLAVRKYNQAKLAKHQE